MPDKLADAALSGSWKEVAELLKEKEVRNDVDVLSTYSHHSSLYLAVHRCFSLNVGHYQSAILLLEAGADPFLFQPNPPFHLTNPFFSCFHHKNLALLRLMLWYAPDYETVSMQDGTSMLTGLRLVELNDVFDRETRSGVSRGFADCIKDTAKDAKRMRVLKAIAASLVVEAQAAEAGELVGKHVLAAKKYAEAAKAFEEAVLIYKKQEKLEGFEDDHGLSEGALIYYPFREGDALPKEYRPVLRAHYEKKRLECLEQLCRWYQIIDGYLTVSHVANDAQARADHATALDRLVELSRFFKKSVMADLYLAKAYRVRCGDSISDDEVVRSLSLARSMITPDLAVVPVSNLSKLLSAVSALFWPVHEVVGDDSRVHSVSSADVVFRLVGDGKDDDDTAPLIIDKRTPTSPAPAAKGGAGDVSPVGTSDALSFSVPTLRHRHPLAFDHKGSPS